MEKEDIKKIAEIAKIKLSEDECEKLLDEMNEILNYFSKIEEMKISDEELYYVNEIYNPLREDEKGEKGKVGEKEKSELLINEFTERKGKYLSAPKVKI